MREKLKRYNTRSALGSTYSRSKIGFKSVGVHSYDIHFEVPNNEIWVRFAPFMESETNFNTLIRNLYNVVTIGTTWFRTDAADAIPDLTLSSYDPVTNIGAIIFNNPINTIGPDAFNPAVVSGFERVSEIYIPWTVELIEEYAFSGCFRLKTLDFRHTRITEVRECAFKDCSQLQALYFPNSLEEIYEEAIIGDNELTYIDLGGNNSIYDYVVRDLKFSGSLPTPVPLFSHDAIKFAATIGAVSSSQNLTIRCNRSSLPVRIDGITTSFISTGSNAKGYVRVLCPRNRVENFSRCVDKSDGSSIITPYIHSQSIYNGPKTFESLDMYDIRRVSFWSNTGVDYLTLYHGNGTIDNPYYIDSSNSKLFSKKSLYDPNMETYADGYGEAGAFRYFTNYIFSDSAMNPGALVVCDKNHLIYHNGKYFSSICFSTGVDTEYTVHLIHLKHRNAAAELWLSFDNSLADADVENISSYAV